jgi:hypothetical protein
LRYMQLLRLAEEELDRVEAAHGSGEIALSGASAGHLRLDVLVREGHTLRSELSQLQLFTRHARPLHAALPG